MAIKGRMRSGIVVMTPSGPMSVADGGRRISTRGSGGMTTRATPTPSAEQLFGTSAERERQIAAFRSGGQAAFEMEVAKARQRAEREEQQRIERARKAEEDKQRRIESHRISGQMQEARVEKFEPRGTPFPTRRELGAESPFFQRAGTAFMREGRFLIGTPTRKDIESERGLFIGTAGLSNVMFREIPTGTEIKGPVKSELTLKEVEQREFLLGGLGTPTEFIAQDISKEVSGAAQERLSKEAGKIQEDIQKGEITLGEGERKLEKIREKEQKQAEKEFKRQFGERTAMRGRAEAVLSATREAKEMEIGGLIKAGAIGVGFAVAPVPTQAALLGTGVLGLGSVPSRPTIAERKAVAIESGLDIVLGAGAFRTVEKQLTQAELERQLGQLSKEPARFAEVRIETPEKDFFRLKRTKDIGAFREEVDVFGRIEKTKGGKFLQPIGVGERRITGVLEGPFVTSPKEAFVAAEKFEVGAKGVAFPLGEKTTGTIGVGTFVPRTTTGFQTRIPVSEKIAKEQLKRMKIGGPPSKQLIAGISREVRPDIFVSRVGKVTGLGISPTQEKMLISANLKDIGVTRVIKPKGFETTFEIAGGEGGLRANIPKVSPPTTITQQTVEKGLQISAPSLITKQASIPRVALGGLGIKGGLGGQITKQRVIPRVRSAQVISPSLAEIAKEEVRPVSRGAFAVSTSQLQATGLKQMQVQVPKLSLELPSAPSPAPSMALPPMFSQAPTPSMIGFKGFVPPAFLGGEPTRKKKKKKRKARKERILPSFTAQVFGLRGRLPKTTVTPFQLRKIPL